MKRFSYLKPIKTKGIFYNSKNTGGMRAKAKATNTLIYILLGFVSLIWILPLKSIIKFLSNKAR